MLALTVSAIDLVVVLLLAMAIAGGFRRGAALQIVTYVGLLLGLLVGALLAPRVAGIASDPMAQAVLALTTFLLLAGAGDALGFVLGRRVWAAARASRFSPFDSAAGSLVAAVALLLATWFVALNLSAGPFPALAREIQRSAIVRALDSALPNPPPLLTQARRFLDRFGFPEVFRDLPPPPAGPVQGPTEGETARAASGAIPATVRVVGEACDAIQEGTGFIAADGYVVTNAHVVAGVGAPVVQPQGGGSHAATPVLFDPGLDLAVLRVDPGIGPSLELLSGDVDRGAKGAVLGYPGGGGLTVGPAAVRRKLEAVGKDIYGQGSVRREVYELQARVRPGNSGGPFVDTAGDVAGVIFAASSTAGNVGYALTTEQVIPRVQRATGRTSAVGTGPCMR